MIDTDRRRWPHDVLKHSPIGRPAQKLAFDDGRELIPGNLAALGYRVAIVTATPSAYASTLTDLLNIDFERLLAGGQDPKAKKLRQLAIDWDIDLADMAYVGDRHKPPKDEDRLAAVAAGCEFIREDEIDLLRRFPRITTKRSTIDIPSGGRILCPNPRCKATASTTLVRLGWRCARCRTPFPASPNVLEGRGTVGRRAAEAFSGLKDDPGRQDRRELQKQFLTDVPQGFRDCVIDLELSEGRFQFPPWLLSKSEIRLDRELRTLAMKAAARLFPVLTRRDGVHVDSLVPYRHEHKELMQKLKDFRNRAGGSGPEVHQSLGYFIALALAGHVIHDAEELRSEDDRLNAYSESGDYPFAAGVAVIPVPSSDFSEAHPGQFSLRLAARVARFLDAELLPVLSHGTGLSDISFNQSYEWGSVEEALEISDYDGQLVILLDDQYTAGRSMRAARASLEERGIGVDLAMTWSQSMQVDEHRPSSCKLRDELGPSWNNCFCSHNQASLDDEPF